MKDLVDFIKGFDLHTIIVVGIAFWWLNSNFDSRLSKLEERFSHIEKDVSLIKTVLITKGIMPESFAHKKGEE